MFNHSQNYGLIICPLSPSHSQSLTHSSIHGTLTCEYPLNMFLLSIQFNSILIWGAAAPQNKTHTRYDGRHTRGEEQRLFRADIRATTAGTRTKRDAKWLLLFPHIASPQQQQWWAQQQRTLGSVARRADSTKYRTKAHHYSCTTLCTPYCSRPTDRTTPAGSTFASCPSFSAPPLLAAVKYSTVDRALSLLS